jgi:hypothetical protein
LLPTPRHAKVHTVQIVVVSSPGQGKEPHWSQEVAGEFARLAIGRGATVRWFVGLHAGHAVPRGETGLQVFAHRDRQVLPVSGVAASQLDAPLELALTECLRAAPLSVVVHFGLGGQGTPNVLWLSDRLGSRAYACVRGIELVCHRGDLLDRDRKSCTEWCDADRCRWCCSESRFGNPSSNDMLNRVDLFIAGLVTCASILVPDEQDIPFVTSLGISPELIEVGATAEQMIDRVLPSTS